MFRFLTAGESHGPGLVAVVEGLPAGLPVDREGISAELARRQADVVDDDEFDRRACGPIIDVGRRNALGERQPAFDDPAHGAMNDNAARRFT